MNHIKMQLPNLSIDEIRIVLADAKERMLGTTHDAYASQQLAIVMACLVELEKRGE